MGDKRRREEGKKRFFCHLALDTLSMAFVFMVHLFVPYNVLLCFTWLLSGVGAAVVAVVSIM